MNTTKQEIFVGIDCSLEKHDYKIKSCTGTNLSRGIIKNQKHDAKRLVNELNKLGKKIRLQLGLKQQTIIISA